MSEPRKVYVVALDYGCEGISKSAPFLVFATRPEAEDFVRRSNSVGNYSNLIIVESEYCS